MFVYTIRNKINDKKYVGKTIRTPDQRWKKHIYNAKHGSPHYFHRAIRKYGPENFEIIGWIEVGSSQKHVPEVLNKLEIGLIAQANLTDSQIGYNILAGGTGGKRVSPKKEKYKTQIITWYSNGKSLPWIAKRVGIHRQGITDWLLEWGVKLRQHSSLSIKQTHKNKIVAWHKAGKSTLWIAKRTAVGSSNAIWRWLKEWGFTRSVSEANTSPKKEKYKTLIVTWYSKGKSTLWIAKKVGVGQPAIWRWLREWGTTLKSRVNIKVVGENR